MLQTWRVHQKTHGLMAHSSQCDTVRPSCGPCQTRRLECVYTTQDAEETRYMALRRENEDLKTKVQELQDLVENFISKPESDPLSRPGNLPSSSGHGLFLLGNDLSVNSAASLLEATQQISATNSPMLNQPLRGIGLMNPARADLQAELFVNHSKAYPKLIPFRNPQVIARNLLNPLRANRLDILAR